jgi:hypothetical protein
MLDSFVVVEVALALFVFELELDDNYSCTEGKK